MLLPSATGQCSSTPELFIMLWLQWADHVRRWKHCFAFTEPSCSFTGEYLAFVTLDKLFTDATVEGTAEAE